MLATWAAEQYSFAHLPHLMNLGFRVQDLGAENHIFKSMNKVSLGAGFRHVKQATSDAVTQL